MRPKYGSHGGPLSSGGYRVGCIRCLWPTDPTHDCRTRQRESSQAAAISRSVEALGAARNGGERYGCGRQASSSSRGLTGRPQPSPLPRPHNDLCAHHRRGSLFHVVVDQRGSDRREHLRFRLLADCEPGHGVARRPWSAGKPLAWQAQCDRAALAEGFLDQALHVLRPVAVGCVEQERNMLRATCSALCSDPDHVARRLSVAVLGGGEIVEATYFRVGRGRPRGRWGGGSVRV